MTRKYIDCRENPSTAQQCTLAISADSDKELIEAAVDHAMKVHGYDDTPELREQMKDAIKEGEPRT
jgi:predicted small metal-binding protein